MSVSGSICPPLLSQQFVCLEDMNHLLSFTHFLSPLLLSSPKHISMCRFFSSRRRASESCCGVKVGDVRSVRQRLSASGRTWTAPPTQRRIRWGRERERRRCRASHWLWIMEGFWSRSCFVTHDLSTACALFYSCQTHKTKSTLHCYQYRLSKDGCISATRTLRVILRDLICKVEFHFNVSALGRRIWPKRPQSSQLLNPTNTSEFSSASVQWHSNVVAWVFRYQSYWI